MTTHLNLHNPSKHFGCNKCGKSFYKRDLLRYHIKRMHSDEPKLRNMTPEKCCYCDKWLSCRSNLNKHIKNLHPKTEMEHRCTTCGFVSTTAIGLKSHILYNHDSEPKYPCHLCNKAFKMMRHLKEHVATHTGEDLYSCVNCGLPFKSEGNMFRHRRLQHREEWLADRTKPPKEKYTRN